MKNIYLIHGWTYSLEKWQALTTLLEKQNLHPIQLKVPGLTSRLTEAWTIDNYMSWLIDVTSSDKEKLTIIGHSNGGRLALNFALKYPERVKQLILIDSAGIYHNGLFITIKRRLFKVISTIGKNLTSSDMLRKLLHKIAGVSDYKNASPIMRQTMTNLLKSDASLNLTQIKVPVTIIWGRNDTITPLSHAYKLHKLIPQSQLHLVEGARHAPFFTHPEKVTQIILKTINI